MPSTFIKRELSIVKWFCRFTELSSDADDDKDGGRVGVFAVFAVAWGLVGAKSSSNTSISFFAILISYYRLHLGYLSKKTKQIYIK